MQSSGTPVSEETSAVYCQALMTTGGVKSLAVTSGHRHVQPYPISHLVTNRSYTASKLTTDYVSVERASEMPLGTILHVKSESKIHLEHAAGNHAADRRKDVTNVDSNKAEYVHFIHPSSDSIHSASSSETVKNEESPRLGRNHTCERTVTLVENNAVYSEIKGDDNGDECYTDIVLPSSSEAASAEVVVERDNLLQHVSRLTTEKQEMVYKLRDFVETNGRLHYTITELQNKLHEVESTLERELREKALLSSRLAQLTSNEHYANREELSNNSQQVTFEGAVVKTGDDLFLYNIK